MTDPTNPDVAPTPWYRRSGWQAIWGSLIGLAFDGAMLAVADWHPTGAWAAVPPLLTSILAMLRAQFRGPTSYRAA